VQHLGARRHGGVVHRVDGVAVGGAEGDVQLARLGTGGRGEPEVRGTVGAGQPDDEAVLQREAHHLAYPDRGEGAQVVGE
jgi:hypothetical protein